MDRGKRPVELVAVATGLVLVVALAVAVAVVIRSDGRSEDARVQIEPAAGLLDAPLRLEVARSVAVLSVGGSQGGYGNPWKAALLASHGYPVLQLAYFGAPGLPRELRSIRLEYVERALQWLHARPGVPPS